MSARRQLVSTLVLLAASFTLLAGAGMLFATCVAGKKLHVARFEPAAAGRWLARLPTRPLATASKHAVDLWLDYSGSGDVTATVAARSSSGALIREADTWHKRSGAVRGSFHRLIAWRPPDPGPWTVEVTLEPGEVELDYGTAGLVEGPFEGTLAGGLTLGLGVLLGLAGFTIRR